MRGIGLAYILGKALAFGVFFGVAGLAAYGVYSAFTRNKKKETDPAKQYSAYADNAYILQ